MKVQKYIVALLGILTMAASVSQAAETCTNFSGNWRGTCVSNQGKYRQDKTNIEQPNCNVVGIDGRFMVFGQGIQTSVNAPNYNTVYEQIDLKSCGSEMQYTYLGMYNRPFSNDSTVVLSVETNYDIRNGKLVRAMNDRMTGFSETCTYSRF